METIQGYKIPFRKRPPIKRIPAFTFTEAEKRALSAEIEKLLEKQAISLTEARDGFTSNMFLVPKKEGQWRLILNLKALNTYTIREHFKMEDIRSVKDLLNKGDYMCKLDLKDAYLSVPINADHRKFLQFQWEGIVYHYKALPFGLATAPRVFTKLLKSVLAHPSSQRTETGGRFGRHAKCRDEQGRNRECIRTDCKQLLEELGFRDQPREITTTDNPVYRVPGLHGQLPLDILQATEGTR